MRILDTIYKITMICSVLTGLFFGISSLDKISSTVSDIKQTISMVVALREKGFDADAFEEGRKKTGKNVEEFGNNINKMFKNIKEGKEE